MPALRRSSTIITTLALLVAGLSAPAAAHRRLPDRIPLPDGFRPEGIVSGHGARAYVGSLRDGDVFRVNLRTGRGRVVSQGDGTPSVGMRLDHRGRLWVAGGDNGTETDGDGDAKVVSARTGRVLAHVDLGGGFVNDVVVTRRAAWFTDSLRAVLYRVPLRHPERVRTLHLRGDWQQVDGFNANGIATTPGGRALLVINSTTGKLYRVNPRTGHAKVVKLGSADLTSGDGLLREGRTLYVVRNFLNEVAVVKLRHHATRGRLVRTLTSPEFDVPTTVASYRGSLFLPNARFTTPGTPDTEYWLTRVSKTRRGR